MKEKTINTRKEILQERAVKDAIVIGLMASLLFIVTSLAGTSQMFIKEADLFIRWKIGEMLTIYAFLFIAALVFSWRRYRELKITYNELDSVEKMKEEFISNLRHELKTPLIPIKGYSELIHEESLGSINEKQKDALYKILDSCEKLLHRIDSLIFVSIASSGDIDYSFTHLRIEDIIDNAVSELRPEINRKGHLIEKNIGKSLPFVYGDRTYLREVFVQVLDNAIKFTSNKETIRVSAYEGHKSVHIKITDNGSGIPEKDLEKIFERFYQADGSNTRKYNGNGLGLYIAKSIITAHNGDIWIESIERNGTTVHIRLPEPDIDKIC